MSTYDPYPPVEPIGYQPVSSLTFPPGAGASEPLLLGRGDRTGARLNERVRSDLTRSARQYLACLVESYNGDSDDVRSIIHDLNVRGPHHGVLGTVASEEQAQHVLDELERL
jgi:hypothetical protein